VERPGGVFGLEDLAAAEWVWVRLWLRRGRLKGTARIDSGLCDVVKEIEVF
jgi:hypothetical protein